MLLSDTQIRKIKPTLGKKASDRYSDGEGLYLHVFASGGKRWIFDFRLDGKRKSYSIGLYPEISLKQAREAKDEARSGTYAFHGSRNSQKPLSENTLLYALYRLGYHSRMTGHGFRGVASTYLHEKGYMHDAIERQLAHGKVNKVSAFYD